MVCLHLNTYFMDHPDKLIKDIVFSMIMALDKQFDPIDIIGGIDDALNEYEHLLTTTYGARQ